MPVDTGIFCVWMVVMGTHDMRMVMVVGESSGDQLAAVMLQGAGQTFTSVHCAGIVGEAMQRQGAQMWWPAQSLAVRGYFEPIRHLPRILKMRSELIRRTIEMQPDVFVGIDAPDFNLGVELKLRHQGIKTMHYVSPSIWAWRPKRIDKIKAAVDHMLLIFPFEQEVYAQAGMNSTYVGHPFAQQIPMTCDTAGAKQDLGLTADTFALAVLPGSRASEINYNAENFLKAAWLMQQTMMSQGFVCLVPVAHANLRSILSEMHLRVAPNLNVVWVDGHRARTVMQAADATIVASGTASLEVALFKKPSIISYRTSWLSAKIYYQVALQPWIGLPNILLREHFIPEVLQDDATPEGLVRALRNEIERYARDTTVKARLQHMHQSLQADTPMLCAQALEQMKSQQKRP